MCYMAHSQVSIAFSISLQNAITLFTYLQCPHGIQHGQHRDTHIGEDGHPHRGDALGGQNEYRNLHADSEPDILHGYS